MNKHKTRPLILTGEEVRAVLDGLKTQMRFMIKEPKRSHCNHFAYGITSLLQLKDGKATFNLCVTDGYENYYLNCPYGCPGDFILIRGEDDQSLTLKIKDIRPERLNDITEADAMAEGVERWVETRWKSQPTHYRIYYHEPGDDGTTYSSTAKGSFETLCQKKYGRDVLDKNPFVWVIDFEMVN